MNPQLSLFDFFLASPFSAKKKQLSLNPRKKLQQKTPSKSYAEMLENYIPAKSLTGVCDMLAKHNAILKITKKRHTKLGDYRPPQNGLRHRITVNQNLNKYSFLITLIHELAHLFTWHDYKKRLKPHGKEWKAKFQELMLPFIRKEIFPEPVINALNNYTRNPAASSCTDTNLLKTLRLFDEKKELIKSFHLEDIPDGSSFSLVCNSKILSKGKRLRKRFLCSELNSKRKYIVSPVAEVILL